MRERKKRHLILAAYYTIAFLLMVGTLFKWGKPNIDFYDMFSLITSLCFAAYFYSLLLSPWMKKTVITIYTLQTLYFIIYHWIIRNESVFDSMGNVILSTGMVIMVFMFLYQILTNITEESLSANFDFWFVSAQLVYFLGSFIIFLTFSYFTRKILPVELYSNENRDVLTKLWGVHNVLLFLSSLLTLGSVAWITFRKKSSLL